MDQQIAVGQHFFTGFTGYQMTEAFVHSVRVHKLGNVILFEHNVESILQLQTLCTQLRTLITRETGYPPLIAMDQEGGTISRLREDATVFPGAMAIAATGDPRNAFIAGQMTALELRAMGVNLNLAPVLDVNSNPDNPVIGVRSYGDDPATVARYGVAMAQGLQDGGVLSCAKHFPGHGDTAVDSHVGLPTVAKELSALTQCELVPFQAAIDARIPAVMTSHILFPRIDPNGFPATLSPAVITGLLRRQMGFQGLVLSDCLMMDAIAKEYGTVPSAAKAFQAGVDMVFISHDPALAAQAAVQTQSALVSGTICPDSFAASTALILQAKARLLPPTPMEMVGSPSHRAEAQRIVRATVTVVQDAPFTLGDHPFFGGCRRFRPTMAANPEDTTQCFPLAMQALLGGSAVETQADPSPDEIRNILAMAASHTSVVIGLYGARQRDGQLALIKQAATLGIPVCAVALRSPYDLVSLPVQIKAYAVYDYNAQTLQTLADVLAGRRQAHGTLPVRLPQ